MVGAYHKRRVAPIISQTLALDEIKPDASPDEITEMVLATGEIDDAEISQWHRETFEKPFPMFPIPGHPVMRPKMGFILFVSAPSLRDLTFLVPLVNWFGCGTLA